MVVSVETKLANVDFLRYAEQASSDTPAASFAIMYFKTDGLLYTKDDAGVETGPITNAAAIVLNPLSDVRNIIEPAADFIPLTVRGSVAAQTKDILVIEEGSGDTTVFSISGTGEVLIQPFTDSATGVRIMDKDGGTVIMQVNTTDELVGFGVAPTNPVHIVSATDPVNISDQAMLLTATWTPPDTDPQWTRGISVFANIAGSNVPTDGYVTGVESNAQSLGAAVQPLRSFSALLRNATSGVVASGTSFYAETPTKGGTGTFTNAYGLYVEDFTAAVNNFSIVTNAGFVVLNESGHAESDIRIETTSEDHFFYIDTGADWLRIGDWDTNYTELGVDGIQTMTGTARVEKTMMIEVGGTGGGANKPTFDDTFSPFDGWLMTVNDELHYEFEIPFDCDTSENIEFEIHWYIDRAFGDESAEVQWQIVYRAVTEDGTEPVDSGGSTATVASGDINIPATNKSYLETGMDIIAANISPMDTIAVDLSRIAIDGGVDPGGAKEPIISTVHITYTANKLGMAL